MSSTTVSLSVFTKPWKSLSISELGEFVAGLGFQGIEFPLRPGYQVEPQNAAKGLPQLAKELAKFGVKVYSVAGPVDEATILACAEAGVPIIRTMANVGAEGYVASVAKWQQLYDSLVPLLDKHGVTIGVQNHCNRFVANADGLAQLLAKYDPKHVAAVWDAAHEALNGMEPEQAIDVIWPKLCMVNLKNAFWQRSNGPEAEWPEWKHYWTTGQHGLASWPRVAAELKKRAYRGVICLTAEYSDEKLVNRSIAQDIALAKGLLG
jgi:sugar phosphate isomerase/epimerase